MTYQEARDCLDRGDLETGLALLNQLATDQPQRADIFYQQGRALLKLGRLQEAIASYTKALELEPTALAYLGRALVHMACQTWQAALIDAGSAQDMQPGLAAAYRLAGNAHRQLGSKAEAIAAYKQAAHLYLEQQDKAAARGCLSQIRELQPVQTLISTADFLHQAREKIERGELRQALSDLDWLLQMEPQHRQARCDRSYVYARLGRGQAALQDINQLLQTEPENIEFRLQRAKVRLALDDAYGALEELKPLLSGQAPSARLFFWRGQSYRQLGDIERAFKDFSNALAMQPTPELYEARAAVQRGEEAANDYQQAASLWLDQGNWMAHRRALDQANALRRRLQAAAARRFHLPIVSMHQGLPIVAGRFNNRYTFNISLDLDATLTTVTDAQATLLQLPAAPGGSAGWLSSLNLQGAIAHNLRVVIVPDTEQARLGQDFLSDYEVRLLGNEIELQRLRY